MGERHYGASWIRNRLLVAVMALSIFIAGSLCSALAQEPARIALLIGNKGYNEDVGPLKLTHSDIEVVGEALAKIGFNVTSIRDADYREMDIAIRRHVAEVRRAGPGAISFFYYSGHGIANPDTGNNYLVPVDVEKADTDNIWFESFEQSVLIDRLNTEARNAVHFVVMDACRNELNLTSSGAKALGVEKGFRPVNDVRGMLIAYATAERQTAADTGDFARILAEEIVKPGIEAISAFRNVQLRVEETLGQEPWMSLRYLPKTYLAGLANEEREANPAPEPRIFEGAREWQAIQNTQSEAVLEAFLRRYPDSPFSIYAEARLQELRRQKLAVGISEQLPTMQPGASCDGVEVSLGTGGKQCVKPGSGESFKDCADCPEMVIVPAGKFMMGSTPSEIGELTKQYRDYFENEEPQHEVTIPKPFAVGKFEVTFAEWNACIADGGCQHKPEDVEWGPSDRPDRPMINVSWEDITNEYLPWLNQKTGKSYRLLTEAEWEYAARAGTETRYSFGDSDSQLGDYGWYSSNSGDKTHPVGQKKPNGWGLYDVHGNAWEWVNDCYIAYYKYAPDDGSAVEETSGCSRALRGGSMGALPFRLRSAYRIGKPSVDRYYIIGFRLARM